jgi:hypothetical protein
MIKTPPHHIHLFSNQHRLPSVPHTGNLGVPHLLLELHDSVTESLGGGRATGNVDIDRDDSVTSSNNRVGVVVVSSSVGARSHGDDPSGLRHLVVNLSQGGCHLVGEGSSDNHNIGLTRRGTENNSHSVLVVTGGGKVHHLYGAACESESHGPQRSLTRPVCHGVQGGPIVVISSATNALSSTGARVIVGGVCCDVQGIVHDILGLLLGRKENLAAGGTVGERVLDGSNTGCKGGGLRGGDGTDSELSARQCRCDGVSRPGFSRFCRGNIQRRPSAEVRAVEENIVACRKL